MNSKIELKQQINYALAQFEMSEEIRNLLISINNDLEKDITENQKMQMWLKWVTVFKDLTLVALNIYKESE
ncbi:hypothetical protein [Chryseobacterium sp. SL1]|uniref:hypothetical protein n=1 Tax=Chryseobacterium sp. SL1 TaxID=2995159 RepID=UPI002274B81E|nr:hypothetical protein [Chryseobacterium sp. SL1]MCY1662805.1 hypothetical protein [Chryseobacterium sp. SL1]